MVVWFLNNIIMWYFPKLKSIPKTIYVCIYDTMCGDYMKNINPTFTDKEFNRIKAVKEYMSLNWRNFLIKVSNDVIENTPELNKIIGGN